jgi:PAS domain-containing protein
VELLATLRSVENKPIELILLRQLASRLPLGVTLVDAQGSVVYINPANERLLGVPQGAVAEFPYDRLHELIEYRHADGSPMKLEDRPLAVALHDRRPLGHDHPPRRRWRTPSRRGHSLSTRQSGGQRGRGHVDLLGNGRRLVTR